VKKGLFLSFEGGEGAGKSTQVKALKKYIEESLKREVLLTREPGGSPLSEEIRKLLLDKKFTSMHARTEALLMAASRAQHVEEVLRPALAQGKIILCDRYWDASRAYQGVGRGLGLKAIDMINAWATNELHSDRCYIFKLDPKEGFKRVSKREDSELDRLEKESLDFHQKVQAAYLFLAKSHPKHYKVIDASKGAVEIQKVLITDLNKILS